MQIRFYVFVQICCSARSKYVYVYVEFRDFFSFLFYVLEGRRVDPNPSGKFFLLNLQLRVTNIIHGHLPGLLLENRLETRAKQAQFLPNIDSCCTLCGYGEERIQYIFVVSSSATNVWNHVFANANFDHIPSV